MPDVSQSEPISTKQRRIAELARHLRGKPLHALSRHIDESWMREAYRRTRKDGAAGVDGETGAKFAVDLEANLSTRRSSPTSRMASGAVGQRMTRSGTSSISSGRWEAASC